MEMDFREWVYDSVAGNLAKGYELRGVENLFATGKECYCLYVQMLDAYERLCDRLDEIDEDQDVEVIFNNFLRICRVVGLQMYDYGVQFGAKE